MLRMIKRWFAAKRIVKSVMDQMAARRMVQEYALVFSTDADMKYLVTVLLEAKKEDFVMNSLLVFDGITGAEVINGMIDVAEKTPMPYARWAAISEDISKTGFFTQEIAERLFANGEIATVVENMRYPDIDQKMMLRKLFKDQVRTGYGFSALAHHFNRIDFESMSAMDFLKFLDGWNNTITEKKYLEGFMCF